MKRKTLWITVAAVALVGLVVAGFIAKRDTGAPVQVAEVKKEDIFAKVSANGKIQAVRKVDISANLMGQVTRLAVKEGDPVKKGQFLLEIDPVRTRAAVEGLEASLRAVSHDLETAKARYTQAQSDFQRIEQNYKAGILSLADFEQSRTALATSETTFHAAQRRVDQSRAGLAEAKDMLRKTTIVAPMDGIVTTKRIEEGETAVIGVQNQPGTVLVTVSDMSAVETELEVDEASIPSVQLKQEAKIRIDAYPNQVFDGVVTEVGGSPILKLAANEAIKFKVKVLLKNPPSGIKPGLSAQAEIFTGSRLGVVAVPIQALVMKEIKRKEGEKTTPGAPKEEEGVYILDSKKKAKFVAIKTGLMGDLNIEITSGLQGGEQVVTGPFKALRDMKDGDSVKVDKGKKKDAKS